MSTASAAPLGRNASLVSAKARRTCLTANLTLRQHAHSRIVRAADQRMRADIVGNADNLQFYRRAANSKSRPDRPPSEPSPNSTTSGLRSVFGFSSKHRLAWEIVQEETGLLYPPPLEEAGVGGVLLDVGGVALLGRILHSMIFLGGVAVCICIELRAFGALITGWDRRHFAHVEILSWPRLKLSVAWRGQKCFAS